MLQKLFGTPKTVPAISVIMDDENELSHGSHGSQGGDKGNEYQAVWMTLACLNAVYSQHENITLQEIILEGCHEPFDDIEIRKSNGSYTLFQSKHRDKQGSNNVTIAELLKLPPKKEKADSSSATNSGSKSDSAPFSLAKYFKGMMKEYNNSSDIENNNFIICVSSTFSTSYKEDSKMIKLEEGTWSENGILELIDTTHLDPLLSSVYINNKTNISIAKICKEIYNIEPKYYKFSQKFIKGIGLAPNQQKLRDKIYATLKDFIKAEKKSDWCEQEIQDDPEAYIGFFFENLQIWFDQPKLDVLKEILVFSLRQNFVYNADTISIHFYNAIRNSAERDTESLNLEGIAEHLRRARGNILAEELIFRSKALENQLHLAYIKSSEPDPALDDFLSQQTSDNIHLIISSDNPASLIYFIFNQIETKKPILGIRHENWLIVEQDNKLILHDHKLEGIIDHGIADLFLSDKIKLLVVMDADQLLSTEPKRQQLKIIAQQKRIKVIYLSGNEKTIELKAFIKKSKSLQLKNTELLESDLKKSLNNQIKKDIFYISHFRNHQIKLTTDIYSIKSLAKALTKPHILANFLSDLKKDDTHTENEYAVFNYQPTPIVSKECHYRLMDILNCSKLKEVIITSPNKEKLKKIKSLEGKFKIDKDNNLVFQINKDGDTLYASYAPDIDDMAIKVDKINDTIKTHIPYLYTDYFSKNHTSIKLSDLLIKSTSPTRIRLTADYGAGKSSQLKQLFHNWLTSKLDQTRYDWVIPCNITDIVEMVKQRINFDELLIVYLESKNYLNKYPALWIKESIKHALTEGTLLLLLDRWDELHESDYPMMSTWLKLIPTSVSLIIASRPHAVNKIDLQFHQSLELTLYEWDDIKNYLIGYYTSSNDRQSDITKEFINRTLIWLGEGDNEKANQILARPLHTKLLADALKPHYEAICKAENEEERIQIYNEGPWNDTIFYRAKLYYLIACEQFKKYLTDIVKVKSSAHLADLNVILSLTQTHQLKLREIAFNNIFDSSPIPIVTALNESRLLLELYNLGIISTPVSGANNKIEFVYRIFAEYFAAQYLLNALLRGPNDFIFDAMVKLIRTHANDKRYEQVFRILGEMIRFGEPLLDYAGIGKDQDVLDAFPQLVEDDYLRYYYAFLKACLNDSEYESTYTIRLRKSDIEHNDSENSSTDSDDSDIDISEPYQNVNLGKLLDKAKSSKSDAKLIIQYLIASDQLSDTWLQHFYKRPDRKISHSSLDNDALKPNIASNLGNLKNKVNNFRWWEERSNNYWDVNVFLPCIAYMHPKLYLMGAAYFIHRISSNGYYNTLVPEESLSVIRSLVNASLDPDSTKLFFMMSLKWLSLPYLFKIDDFDDSLVIAFIQKISGAIETGDDQLKLLSINLLFALVCVFKLRLQYDNQNPVDIIITLPIDRPTVTKNLDQANFNLLQTQFSYLAKEVNFNKLRLPYFEIDGSNLDRVPKSPEKNNDVNAAANLLRDKLKM